MKTQNTYGGNQVMALDTVSKELVTFAHCSYTYYQVVIKAGEQYNIQNLQSYTVFLPDIYDNGEVIIVDTKDKLMPGDSAQIEGHNITLLADESDVRVLVSGVENQTGDSSTAITRAGEHYKVTKPWGHELWLSGERSDYAFKEVFIKSGNRTSLQYHKFKEETNILFQGKALLVYQAGETHQDLGETELSPISSIHVLPDTLHRLVALEDTLLYETSTPHLDDVFRVEDDSEREDGRVLSEHGE